MTGSGGRYGAHGVDPQLAGERTQRGRPGGIGCGDLVHADDARSGPRRIRWSARQWAPRASPRVGSGDPAAVPAGGSPGRCLPRSAPLAHGDHRASPHQPHHRRRSREQRLLHTRARPAAHVEDDQLRRPAHLPPRLRRSGDDARYQPHVIRVSRRARRAPGPALALRDGAPRRVGRRSRLVGRSAHRARSVRRARGRALRASRRPVRRPRGVDAAARGRRRQGRRTRRMAVQPRARGASAPRPGLGDADRRRCRSHRRRPRARARDATARRRSALTASVRDCVRHRKRRPGPRGPRPVRARRPAARLGAGGTHHVAFRAPSLEDVDRYAALVAERRLPSSGVIDRTFFHNLYFREPGGALFEIAADVPGRSPYPSDAEIGTTLVLPDHLEPHRAEIERSLHPIEGIAA